MIYIETSAGMAAAAGGDERTKAACSLSYMTASPNNSRGAQPASSTALAGSNEPRWHSLAIDAVLDKLGSSERGLSGGEVDRRLRLHGPNELEQTKGEGPWQILWRQINSPLIWVLIGAAAVAGALGKVADALVVLAVVILNSIVGFVQEFRANKAIEALRAMVPEFATVVREGKQQSLAIAQLVPGDVVKLASGDKIPADLRLITVTNLRAEEAALTGESTPVLKQNMPVDDEAGVSDRTCMAFGGTLVTYGTAVGVVTTTGGKTELGRISRMLQETTHIQTPLTRALASVGKYITLGILAVTVAIVVVGIVRSTQVGASFAQALQETLMFAIALAVGAIPEGLPAIVTIALAIGVQRMAKRKAVIRRLPAVETLGSTTVICSDKTGTLTRNEMTATDAWTPCGGSCSIEGVGYEPKGDLVLSSGSEPEALNQVKRLLKYGALASDASLALAEGKWTVTGDPTEGALIVAAAKAGFDVEQVRQEHRRHQAIPFESEHQFMATVHEALDGECRMLLKGAPERVLGRCEDHARDAETLAVVEQLAADGKRVLAVAQKQWQRTDRELSHDDAASGFELVGLVGMVDPPRPEAIAAVRACRAAGIQVKMITGDHKATAHAIGRDLALADHIGARSGHELSSMSEAQLSDAAENDTVFARVAPEHKLGLVKALQARGHVVAMTGDGVNDAPALKQSNIGVAMGITGTSVSKESADIVLLDDNFASIVAAVEEGRRVYDNLVKSLAFVLPTNLGLALVIIYAVLFFPFDPSTHHLLLPILPVQILWINLVATVALALPLAFEAKESDVMTRPPRDPNQPVLSTLVIRRTFLAAVLMTAAAILLFYWKYARHIDGAAAQTGALAEAQTVAVTTIIFFQIFYMFTCRSLRGSMSRIGVTSNPWVFVGVVIVLGLQTAFIYAPPLQAVFRTAPLGPLDLLAAAVLGAVIVPVIAVEKLWWRRSRAAGALQ